MDIIQSAKRVRALEKTRDVVFVDCRFQLNDPLRGYRLYQAEHIPGAVYMDLDKEMSGKAGSNTGRHPMPDLTQLKQTLEEKGIKKDSTIIAYDEPKSPFAARFYWLMKAAGHQDVCILNGGLSAWKQEDFPVTSEVVNRPVSTYHVTLQEELIADQSYVQEAMENKDITLLDARSFERFAGFEEPIDKKAGHIPTAESFEWLKVFNEDGYWKKDVELKELFEPYLNAKEIIVYCGSGVTAAPPAVALREAGFRNVSLYVGSFSDWISNEANKINTLKKQP
ncbi:sulfurtransferase [Pontibacillus salicampi]|uniref:Sulfurtransferase n=1 Tax=Pontibacillus salicampi TaxID=1449801 RepID=A0ABV6LLE2_9BACI